MALRLATFNVENLFARAKALDTADWQQGEPVLAAFATFNRIAAKPAYDAQDKTSLLSALETLRVLVRNRAGSYGPIRIRSARGRCFGRTAATSWLPLGTGIPGSTRAVVATGSAGSS